jgi:crotonobetainyl-CoA:carnitine CoA-transferase CaiB-like acyl-CoA transferase
MPPLTGLRVVDFTRNVAGPFATMLLGDMGAEIIKIERPPRGDEARYHGPPFLDGESPYFLSLNRNKRSLVLDLKAPRGLELARTLCDRADIVVNNFRAGVMDRLGLGWLELRATNPRLIACNITGFGQDGPLAHAPAYDHIVQGMSGLMSVTGTEASGPLRLGVSISDTLTGLFALYGILAALYNRERSGLGEEVNASLLASSVAALTFQAGAYFATGQRPRPHGNDHPMIAPYGTFRTSDGHLNISVGNDRMFRSLCAAIGRTELLTDPRFGDNPARVDHRAALHEVLGARFAERPTADWLELLGAAGVACGPVLGIDEILHHPQVIQQQLVETVEHDALGSVDLLGLAVKLSRDPAAIRSAPPGLGRDSADVLRELGCDDAEIARLVADGTVALGGQTGAEPAGAADHRRPGRDDST